MQKSKSGFTMIELIFVIVILGILAAVIIPKLAATRADAQASVKANAIMTGTTEIVSYAMAVGQLETNLSMMSNAFLGLASSGDAVLSNNQAVISAGSILDCVTIQIDSNDTLNASFGNANANPRCVSLQSLINLDTFPIQLKGSSVVY